MAAVANSYDDTMKCTTDIGPRLTRLIRRSGGY
jgi:hypothetical protein